MPAKGPGPTQRERGDAGGGARWARWGRCAQNFPMATTWTTILDLLDGDIEGRGQPGAARRRWRRSGRRAGAQAVGRIRGRGARGIVGLVGRAVARGGDGGAAWRAAWERAAVGRGPDRGKRGTWGGRRRKAALGSGAGGAWVQDAGDGIFLAAVGRLLRGWLCREGEMKKETAYAASLR